MDVALAQGGLRFLLFWTDSLVIEELAMFACIPDRHLPVQTQAALLALFSMQSQGLQIHFTGRPLAIAKPLANVSHHPGNPAAFLLTVAEGIVKLRHPGGWRK
jgi:hypothetical protein